MSKGAEIIPFQCMPSSSSAPFTPDERDCIMATLQNLMGLQQQHEQQMTTLIAVIGELQSHVRDLQHHVARLQKEQAKKPVILNAQGARAN